MQQDSIIQQQVFITVYVTSINCTHNIPSPKQVDCRVGAQPEMLAPSS